MADREIAFAPTFEMLEERVLLAVSAPVVLNTFPGLDFTDTSGFVPPDTHAAAGPNHVVQVVNSNVSFFDKGTGTRQFSQDLNTFFAPVGAVQSLFDPKTAFDEIAQRFVVIALELDTAAETSHLLFAVSDDANPSGSWEMHRIDVEDTGTTDDFWGDYPGLGWDADAYYVTLNMFGFTSGFDHVSIITINKQSVTDGQQGTIVFTDVDRNATHFTLQPAVMHGAQPGDPMFFVSEAGANNGSMLRIVQMENKFSTAPSFTTFDIGVAPYGFPPSATQPGTAEVIESNDTRILNAAWRGDRLVASQTVDSGSVARARWYEFDTSSAAPSLVQQGEINQGPGVHTYFPSIEIGANGVLGMTFMESSTTEFMSMYATGRGSGDPLGQMRNPVLVKAGEATYTAFDGSPFRAGDYSGISVDPIDNTFWVANEYATSRATDNWGTWIAQVEIEPFQVDRPPSVIDVTLEELDVIVTFSEPVTNVTASTFLFERSGFDGTFNDGNEIAFSPISLVSDATGTTWTFTVDPTDSVLPDTYRITLEDSITDLDPPFINQLDGEFTGALPSGDGVEGGDFVFPFQVTDRAARIFIELTDASDTGVKGDRTTKQSRPTLEGMILDAFPALTRNRPLGIRVDLFADFAGPLGNADFAINGVTTDDNSEFQFQIPAGNPLPEGIHRVEVTFTDLNGNVSTVSRGIRVDLTAPRVTAADVDGLDIFPLGSTPLSAAFSQINVIVDDPAVAGTNLGLDPGAASLPSNYQLIASGGDGIFSNGNDLNLSSAISSISVAFDPAVSSQTTLTLTVDVSVLVDDVYQFVVKSGVTDAAGNALDGDANGTPGPDFVRQFELDVTAPRVLEVSPDPRTLFETGGLDPEDDTFGLSPEPDIAGLGVQIVGANLEMVMHFFEPVFAPSTDPLDGLFGFIDIDSDRNPTTGIPGHQETLGPSINAALGVDFYIDLGSERLHSGLVDVVHALSGLVMGTAPITFLNAAVSITAPLALFGSAGPFNMGAIVGLDLNQNGVLQSTETTDEVLNAATVASVAAPAATVVDTDVIVGANVNASQDPSNFQSEMQVDVNPTNPQNIIAFTHRFASTFGPFDVMDTFRSLDGGLTWETVPIDDSVDGFGPGVRFDPSVAFDANGNVYIAYGFSDGATSALIVARSTDQGATYTATPVIVSDELEFFEDKWFLATGPDANNPNQQNVYVSWTRFPAFAPGFIAVSASPASNTGGPLPLAFTGPARVNDGTNFVQLSEPAVGVNGELYVSWVDFSTGQIMFDVDANGLAGGLAFGADIVVGTTGVGFSDFIPAQPQRGIQPMVSVDVDHSSGPFRGRVYVSYTDTGPTGVPDTDIVAQFADPSDLTTWSSKVRVNDDATDNSQFLGWLDVDPTNGNVVVIWYDARNDPGNGLVDVFIANSIDGGASFGANVKVTDAPSDQRGTIEPFQDFLEYISVAAFGNSAHVIWADNTTSLSDLELFTARVDFGDPTARFDIATADARLDARLLTLTVGFDPTRPIAAPSTSPVPVPDNRLFGFIDLETNPLTGNLNPGTGNAGVDFFVDLGSELSQPGFVNVVNNTGGTPLVVGRAPILYTATGIQITVPRTLLAGLGGSLSYDVVAQDSSAVEADRTGFNPSVAAAAPSASDPTADLFNTPGFPFAPPDLTGSNVAINNILGLATFTLSFSANVSAPSSSPFPDNRVFGFVDLDLDRDVTTGAATNAPLSGVDGTGMAGAELVVDLGSEALHPGFVDLIKASTGIVIGQAAIVYAGNELQFSVALDDLTSAGLSVAPTVDYRVAVGTSTVLTDEIANHRTIFARVSSTPMAPTEIQIVFTEDMVSPAEVGSEVTAVRLVRSGGDGIFEGDRLVNPIADVIVAGTAVFTATDTIVFTPDTLLVPDYYRIEIASPAPLANSTASGPYLAPEGTSELSPIVPQGINSVIESDVDAEGNGTIRASLPLDADDITALRRHGGSLAPTSSFATASMRAAAPTAQPFGAPLTDLAGNILDGEALGFADPAGGFQVLFNDGRRLPGLSGDGLPGGDFISSFAVAAVENIVIARADYDDDPLLSFDDPDGTEVKPFPTLQRALGVADLNGDGVPDPEPNSVAGRRLAGATGPIIVRALESLDAFSPFVVASPSGSGVPGTIEVPDFSVLSFDPGTVVKLFNSNIEASGLGSVLHLNGSPTNPVLLTSLKDDSVMGDTNNDGDNSSPAPGDWGGLLYRRDSQDSLSLVNFATIRFGGGPVPLSFGLRTDPIFLEGARPVISNTLISEARSAQAAISADFDSFQEDSLARGLHVRDVTLVDNSINGIWLRPAFFTGVAEQTDFVPVGATFTWDDPVPLFVDSLVSVGSLFTASDPGRGSRGEVIRLEVPNRLNVEPGVVVKFRSLANMRVEGPGTLNVGDRRFLNSFLEGTGQLPSTFDDTPVIFTSARDDAASTGTDLDGDGVLDLIFTPAMDTNNDGALSQPSVFDPGARGLWGSIVVQAPAHLVMDEAEIRFGGGPGLGPDDAITSIDTGNVLRTVLSLDAWNGDFPGFEGLPIFVSVTNNRFVANSGAAISTDPDLLRPGDPADPLASGNPFFRGNVLENNDLNGLLVRTVFDLAPDPFRDRVRPTPEGQFEAYVSNDTLWDDTDIVHIVRGLLVPSEALVDFVPRTLPNDVPQQPTITMTLQSAQPGTRLANGEVIANPGESLVVKLAFPVGAEDLDDLGTVPWPSMNAGFQIGMDDGNDGDPAGYGLAIVITNGVPTTYRTFLGNVADHGLRSELRITGIPANEVLDQERVPVILTSLADDSIGVRPRGVGQFDTNSDGSATTPAPGDWGGIIIGSQSQTDFDPLNPSQGSIFETVDIRYHSRLELQGGGQLPILDLADPIPGLTADDLIPPAFGGAIPDQRRGAFDNNTKAITVSNSIITDARDIGLWTHAGFRLRGYPDFSITDPFNFMLIRRMNAVGVPAEAFVVNTIFANNAVGIRITGDTDTGADCGSMSTSGERCPAFATMAPRTVVLHSTFFGNATAIASDYPGTPEVPANGLVMNSIIAGSTDIAVTDLNGGVPIPPPMGNTGITGQGQFNLYFGNAQNGFIYQNSIFGNPLFVDAANGDFRLRPGSAAIDASLSEFGANLWGDFLKPIFINDIRTVFGRSGAVFQDELVRPPSQSFLPVGLFNPGQGLNLPGNPGFDPDQPLGVLIYTPLPNETDGERDFFGFQRLDDPGTPNIGFGSKPFFDIGAIEFRELGAPVVTDFEIVRDASNFPISLVATFSEDLDLNSVFFAGLNGTFIVIGSGGDGTFGDGNEFVVSPSAPVTFDPVTNRATYSLAGQVLPSDRYRVTLKGNGSPVMVDLDGVRLDGEFSGTFPSGDGFPGGDFVLEFSVDADPAEIVLFSLDPASDSNIDEPPGREITSVDQPTFIGTVTDIFPGSVAGLLVELDVDGDGAFDDGQALTNAMGNFSITVNKVLLDSDDPNNPGVANGTIVVDPMTGALFNEMRVRVTDDGFNQTIASTLVRIDTKNPKVVAATPAATIPPTVFRQTLTSVDITFGDGDGPVEDMEAAQFNNTTVVLLASGNDGNFNSGNEVVIVPTGFTFDFPSSTLSIQVGALLNDFYQLTLVTPTIRDLAGNLLDGEFSGTLPSGDGVPGGNFVYEFVLADPANARDLLVDINSPTTLVEDGLSLPTAFDTIQEAIDVARPGDRVVVLDGIYDENVVLRSVVDVVADRPGLGVVTDLDGPDAGGNYAPGPVPGGGDVDADGLFGAKRTLIQPAAGNAVDASNTFEASIQGFGIIALGGIGVLSNDTDVLINGNIIAQNQTGIQVNETTSGNLPRIQNNLIWSNLGNGVQFGTGVAGNNGAGLTTRVVNNTFVFNSGTGITVDTTFVGVLNLQNNVFASNTGAAHINRGTTSPTIEFNLFAPTTKPPVTPAMTLSSTNKIVSNPQFVFPVVLGTTFDQLLFLQADFTPQTGSPMIDAANGNVAPTLDLRGFVRFDDPAVPNTGVGSPPFVDIGAFERGGTLPVSGSGGTGATASLDSVGLFDPVSSKFFLNPTNQASAASQAFRFGPSDAGWLPVTGDWDGNGSSTAGLFDPVHGTFFLTNVNAPGVADTVFRFGPAGSGWLPIAGDWDGDGDDTVGLYDPVTGTFFLNNSNTPGAADVAFRFGPRGAGWEAIVGDWNGDGIDSVGLFDPATSTFFLKDSHSPGPADLSVRFGPKGAGWDPVVGDWNQDGTDTIGLHDPVQGAFFLKNTNTAGVADTTFRFGPAGSAWMPLSGDWDGISVSTSTSTTSAYSYAAATTGLAGESATSTDDESTESVAQPSSSVNEPVLTSGGGSSSSTVEGNQESINGTADSSDDDSLDIALLELVDEWSQMGLSDPLN